jgi:hypothetical protein
VLPGVLFIVFHFFIRNDVFRRSAKSERAFQKKSVGGGSDVGRIVFLVPDAEWPRGDCWNG